MNVFFIEKYSQRWLNLKIIILQQMWNKLVKIKWLKLKKIPNEKKNTEINYFYNVLLPKQRCGNLKIKKVVFLKFF